MRIADRPGLVIVVVVTDWEDNSSKEFFNDQIKRMISRQQQEYGWPFALARLPPLDVPEPWLRKSERPHVRESEERPRMGGSRGARSGRWEWMEHVIVGPPVWVDFEPWPGRSTGLAVGLQVVYSANGCKSKT